MSLPAAAADDSSEIADSIRVRFGLRVVSVISAGSAGDAHAVISINGEPVTLKGFNRHDMYPQWGPAM